MEYEPPAVAPPVNQIPRNETTKNPEEILVTLFAFWALAAACECYTSVEKRAKRIDKLEQEVVW